MAQAEQNAYQRLKERVTRPKDRFERMENGLVDGMPDVNYCIVGTEGWIEIKCPKPPKGAQTPLFTNNHPVSIEQRNWMLKQSNAGGISFLFIACSAGLILMKGAEVALLTGQQDVNRMSLIQLRALSCWNSPLPVPALEWVKVRGYLIGDKHDV